MSQERTETPSVKKRFTELEEELLRGSQWGTSVKIGIKIAADFIEEQKRLNPPSQVFGKQEKIS